MKYTGTLELLLAHCNTVAGFDITVKSRKKIIVWTRYCFYKIAKKHTKASLEAIGNVCGGKDHSSVLHGLREFEIQMVYEDFRSIYEALEVGIDPDAIEASIQDKLDNRQKREIKYLQSNRLRLEKNIQLLNAREDKSIYTKQVKELFDFMSKEELNEFLEFKLLPHVQMLKSKTHYKIHIPEKLSVLQG